MQRVTLSSPEAAARRQIADAPSTINAGHPPLGARGRVRLEEVLAIACLLVALCADLALLRVGLDPMDEGYFAEQATRVLRGDVPYRDFDSLYTPGLLYLHALLFGVLGDVHVVVPRVIGLLMRALLAGGLYLVCRTLTQPKFAVLPGLYVLVGLDRIPFTWEPHPGWPSAALTVLAVWAFARLPELSNRRRMLWLIGIGMLTGLVFAFKQNAGAFLVLALVAFTAWQGIEPTSMAVTRALRFVQVLLAATILAAVAWLIHPVGSVEVSVYFLAPLAAATMAVIVPVRVSSRGRGFTSWLLVLMLIGLGCALVTLPWLLALIATLDGRVELLKGFVGAMDHGLLWHPLQTPTGGAWASLLGLIIAALLAIRARHYPPLLGAAFAASIVFAASALVLTGEPGEDVWLAALLAPGRSAAGLPAVLTVLCMGAGAWLALRSPPTLATWRLRWLTVASALTFLTQYPRMDDVHLAWSAGLPLAIGAVAIGRLHARLASRWRLGHVNRHVLYAVLLVVPTASVMPGLANRGEQFVALAAGGRLAPRLSAVAVETGLPAVEGLIVTDEHASTLLAAARFVQANTAAGEPIFVYPSSPLLYVATERHNPTRFAHLYPGAASDAELQAIISELSEVPVRVVVVSGEDLAFWGPPADNQPLEEYLAHSYREVARFGGYRVLLRN